ncbi:MAG: VanW family protein [Actinomycetes bacterium]
MSRDWLSGAPERSGPERAADAVPGGSDPEANRPDGPGAGTAGFAADDPTTDDRAADEDATQRLDVAPSEPPPAPEPAHAGPPGGLSSPRQPGAQLRADLPAAGPRRPWWRRRAVLAPAGAVAVLAAVYGADLAISQGNIPRSTLVAGVDIGGLSPAAAATALEEDLAPRVAADHTVVADDVEATLSPAAAGITLDVPRTIDAADDQPLNPWTRLVTLFDDRTVRPVLAGEDTALNAQLETIAAQVDRAPVDATIAIEGTTAAVVDPADGRTLDREGAARAITEALATGGDPTTPIELPVEITPVAVGRAEAERVLEETVEPALSAPVALVGGDGTQAEVPVAAIAASLTFTPEDDGELAVGIDPEALRTSLGGELAAFGTPAVDADFAISGGSVTVVPSVDGTGVDPAKLADQLLPVLATPAPRSVTVELGPVPADFTTEEAQALGIKEQISSFTTRLTSPASGTNIRVVAPEVDGALVLPGETFSLNTFTGPRGTAQGYVEAAVIQNGELSRAVGGGISQFATTMFNAVFFAGLEDVFHKPHSFYISRYPAGREATVYEGAIDLQWRNDTDTGVYIDTTWTPGSITVTFYGTKRYEIQALESARTNYRQPTVQNKVDDGNCTEQPGIPGFDVTVTRVFRDLSSGAELRRETFQTRYAAEAIINCIPPAEAAPAPEGTTPGG